jgi:hypothetical protein
MELAALRRQMLAAAAAASSGGDAGGLPRSLLQDVVMAAAEAAVPQPPQPKPKIAMKFPGFASASATGPWSREAHDLLGMGRPGGRSE